MPSWILILFVFLLLLSIVENNIIAFESVDDYMSKTSLPTSFHSIERRRAPLSRPSTSLKDFLTQLDSLLSSCNNENNLNIKIINGQLIQKLINGSIQRILTQNTTNENLKKESTQLNLLLSLAQIYSKHPYIVSSDYSLPPNSTITSTPLTQPDSINLPAFAFQLLCNDHSNNPYWVPLAIYKTVDPHKYLQMRLPKLSLDVCDNSDCQTHVIVREKRHEQHDRGWALMESFFMGAIILYAIPLLGWPEHIPWSCWIADLGRQLGFTLFYGSVILKIYRNLQEYRVRKAQHVIVRELDLILYLLFAILIVLYGILAWSSGSWTRSDLWTSQWPQCPVEEFRMIFSLCEQMVLFYGIRLCYKARNSSWIERYQFTMAVILEAIISLVASAIRYALNEVGSRDALFLVAVLQLHLTISLNIIAIIAPKFLFSTESTARGTLNSGNTTAITGSNRAHPSLAKMRENLINGTIDFQEVPIVDMNPEDIRAELKRVYTQLRMYKLKNAYQDNPHISKRKGGAGIKKVVNECNNNIGGGKTSRAASASAAIDRRISIPPQISSSNNSPNKFIQQKLIEEEEDGKNNDLTVESAPHNIHLLTTTSGSNIKLNSPTDVPLLSSSDQSIRV
uniref:G_PROTEIN_RECEP_F3_4 domain-containing protein n=1 Tax=Meloidogyne hapla TaxID=6305 RepID=A0A1I8C1U7_MELHA